MMENPIKIKRRTYLIKSRFQLKYTGLILLFMFIVAWLVGYTVYYTGWLLMGERLANVYPQGRLVAIMRTIDLTLFLRLLLVTPLVALVSILLSHRIAGPVYRIEQFLKSVAQGDLSMKLRLRKGDELRDLADAINEMTSDLKNRVNKLKGLTNMAELELEKLKMMLGEGIPDIKIVKSEVDELANSIKDLDDHLSEYRLSTVED
ncbi:MAG: methyl-accepting chemotaxis protein [Candidatus Omnitrophica bacterium]|nr:methyl-accepting chemotaxis protein [Candidatus Omnitrophota bacterium]